MTLLWTDIAQLTLVDSPVVIAQAAWDTNTGYIAWLTIERELFVQRWSDDKPLLHVLSAAEEAEGAADAA